MSEGRDDGVPGSGTNGAPAASEATRAPFVPARDVATAARTPRRVLVEPGTLADGRAIRFFSWAADR